MRLIPNDLYSLRHISQRSYAQQSTSGKKREEKMRGANVWRQSGAFLYMPAMSSCAERGLVLSPYNHPADDQVRKGGAPEKRPVPLFSGRAGRL